MSAASKLLDRLAGVKQTGPNRWIAKSPLRDERTASLSVRETDDGRILLHDFGGDSTGDILAAIGLSFSDLFARPLEMHLPPVRGGFNSRELLELIQHEVLVACLIISDTKSEQLDEEAQRRLALACARITHAKDLAYAQ